MCLWGAGSAHSIKRLVGLLFPEVGGGPHQMNVHQPGSDKAGFAVLLLKGA